MRESQDALMRPATNCAPWVVPPYGGDPIHSRATRKRARRAVSSLMYCAGLAVLLVLFVVGARLMKPPANHNVPRAAERSALSRSAGSVGVGSAVYGVPSVGVLFVAVGGSDSGSGSLSDPLGSVSRAVLLAGSGSTVVLRGGVYHESVSLPVGKALTVQAFPGESVWFDGSVPVSSWSVSGSVWRAGGWSAVFDHSPTYTPGAPDSTTPGWSFVNAAHPLAAYPDQLFVDGVAQEQVGSLALVGAGKFFVDTAAQALFMGTDPVGHAVRASDLSTAFTVNGAGSVLRGFGVRRYATSVPLKGAIRSLAANVTLENLVVSDNATQGIYVGGRGLGTGNTLRQVTVERNGLLGIESSYADGFRAIGVRAVDNNTEHFNSSPVSGGLKIGRVRHISITGSVFSGNEGPGLWMDESVFDATVTGNDFVNNTGHGLSFEISSDGVFADNLVAGNGGNGMKMNNVSNLTIVNNTFINNAGKPLWLVQDSRVASNVTTPGHDPRQPLPDPTMTWILGPATVTNNIFSGTNSNCYLCVEDTALHRSATTMGITTDGNLYNRPTTTPTWLILWADPELSNATMLSIFRASNAYTSLATFREATDQERHGDSIEGRSVVDAHGNLVGIDAADISRIARPLSPRVAALLGKSAAFPHLGVWEARSGFAPRERTQLDSGAKTSPTASINSAR